MTENYNDELVKETADRLAKLQAQQWPGSVGIHPAESKLVRRRRRARK